MPLSTWTRVTVSRQGRDGTLRVNEEEPVVGRSRGTASELNLQMRLYVGGLPGRPDSSSGVSTGFVGAIQRVRKTMLSRSDDHIPKQPRVSNQTFLIKRKTII